MCWSKVRENTSISSRYTETKSGPELGLKGVTTCCIKRLKTAGALVSPKGITRNSNSPCCIVNAVFSCESGCMRICQNPEARLMDEKYADCPSWSSRSSIVGSG